MDEYVLILSTCSELQSRKIAHTLVDERFAACVNIHPVRSVYRWKGEVVNDDEDLLLIKTKKALVPGVIEKIKKIHSYEVPEVIVIPIIEGEKTYLTWIDEQTSIE